MKTSLTFLLIVLLSNIIAAQTTAIPDPNFEQALINLGYDTGTPDGQVLTANINSVTSLEVINKFISDLTGIEDFTALTTLECYQNQFTYLDLTQNINLTTFACEENNLPYILLDNNEIFKIVVDKLKIS